ncbi:MULTISPECIES: caspase, EACC1-associated type [unclassified Streptomyces]|uniref:caspase, EACC1-associated type n=1 Tax=unclassified Streptomyces TaxID=2593676 RepID=UPI002E821B79|nr:DnaJ C-terminal domain-containing protein [Streptomyces sp. NBC_00589]WTI37813.1 caspase family protein [Streptomyces sp. NBC_00775]WUB28508.1 caspase family protein [Streptomyces sp. NBC_00589]
MADALDGDFSRSRAVLIGTWDYTDLAAVPAAEHSLDRLQGLLTGPLCGWPEERLLPVRNERSVGDLPHTLVENFADVADVALFYYVGHGQYDLDDKLCLALGESSQKAAFRTTTSLTFDHVRHAFRVSRAATKIAILDCCFAGLAGQREGVLSGTGSLPPKPGSFLMMASGEFSTAWFQSAEEFEKPETYFTKYLVDVVERGIPGQGEGLRLGAIFDTVAGDLVRDRKPEPGCRTSDQASSFYFARNLAAGERGRDIRAEAVVALRDALVGAVVSLRLPVRCDACEGVGKIDDEECTTCHGTGEAQGHRSVSTRLHPGVLDGEIVRVPEEGWAGAGGGPPGDLLVTVHVNTDPDLARSGDDLLTTLAISHPERASGNTISLRLLDDWVGVRVPIGSEYGTVLRIPRRGAPTPEGSRGDLVVTFEATAPVTPAEDAGLMPPSPRPAPLLSPPTGNGSVTNYRWPASRVLWQWLGLLLVLALVLAPAFVVVLVRETVPGMGWLPGSAASGLILGIFAGLFPVVRRLLAWRRPPLVLSDEGVTYTRFGFISWADVAGVRPSAPGHPWVTVVPRRTTHLTTGQPNPLVLPTIMLSDLRGRPENVTESMRAHCPSLVVAPRA